jgi:hypothetical protein
MNITQFGRPECKVVAEGAMAALEAYAKSMGLVVERDGGGRYDSSSFTMKVKFTAGGEEGREEKQRKEFERYASLYRLEPGDYNREFSYGSKRMRITGFAHRRRKYPYICVEVDTGKEILLPEMALTFIKLAREGKTA